MIQKALEVKMIECSHETGLDYKSYVHNFMDYLRHINKQHILGTEFSRKLALEYSDYLLIEKRHANITRNNNMRAMKSLFYILTDRAYLKENVFSDIKKLREAQKRRKVFSETECSLIVNYVKKSNPALLTAIYACYFCALRRTELLRLKVEDIDLENGYILIDGTDTKNGRNGSIIIPQQFLDYLRDIRINQYPKHYFVFGQKIAPSATKCGKNTIPTAHRTMLRLLAEYGLLDDIEGKSFYSWKDTAARDMIRAGITAPDLQKHFRHKDLNTTQRYFESFGVNNNTVRGFEAGFVVG
jgi:integrase